MVEVVDMTMSNQIYRISFAYEIMRAVQIFRENLRDVVPFYRKCTFIHLKNLYFEEFIQLLYIKYAK